MTSKLTGFSPRSARRVAGVWTVFVLASAGWALGGQLGAVMAVVVGVALVFVQWWGQPAWSWAVLGLRGRRPVKWNDPITLANNRSGGGVRVQDGVAVVAVQLLGRAHRATTVTGSVTVESDNVIDVVELAPLLRHRWTWNSIQSASSPSAREPAPSAITRGCMTRRSVRRRMPGGAKRG